MNRPQLPLAQYRRLASLSMLASVVVTVAGLYQFLYGRWIPGLLFVGAGVLLLLPSQVAQIRVEPGSENQLVFVTKPECSLCDEARLILPELTKGTPFEVEEVALESSRRIRRTFRHRVPVLLWQGAVVADLRWDVAAVRSRLEAILRERGVLRPPGESP